MIVRTQRVLRGGAAPPQTSLTAGLSRPAVVAVQMAGPGPVARAPDIVVPVVGCEVGSRPAILRQDALQGHRAHPRGRSLVVPVLPEGSLAQARAGAVNDGPPRVLGPNLHDAPVRT